jgi:hypothetical protein
VPQLIETQISGIFAAVPRTTRGALRGRHERWVRDAVDAGGARDECADADGEVVAS